MPVAIFVFEIGMSIKDHQGTFSFDIAYDICNAVLWRYLHKHVYMVWTKFRFDDSYTFSLAEHSYDFSDFYPDLTIDDSSSILWRKDDVILTIPRGMC